MTDTPPEEVIDNAASYLIKKIEGRHRSHTNCEKCIQKMMEGDFDKTTNQQHNVHRKERNHKSNKVVRSASCSCLDERTEIQEGTKSPLVSSPDVNRRFQRREGVAERNQLERRLAKVAVKEMRKSKSCDLSCIKMRSLSSTE